MWYIGDVLYAMLYVRVSCFVVRGCAGSRRYINVCNYDMFSVVNVYLDHLELCVVCIFLYRKNLLQEFQQERITRLYNIYNLTFSID